MTTLGNYVYMGFVTTSTTLHRTGSNWIIGTVDGLWVESKAFADPSSYGMAEDARISILYAIDGGVVVFDYDRNDLNINNLSADRLALIVSAVAGAIQ